MPKGSQNLKYVAPKTAEISSIQISTNARTATPATTPTPRDRRFFFSFFISPFMPLTGLSLEIYIFHFEAISLSTHISGSKRPIFTYLGSLERPWPVDGS
jgi:hypothetical protein